MLEGSLCGLDMLLRKQRAHTCKYLPLFSYMAFDQPVFLPSTCLSADLQHDERGCGRFLHFPGNSRSLHLSFSYVQPSGARHRAEAKRAQFDTDYRSAIYVTSVRQRFSPSCLTVGAPHRESRAQHWFKHDMGRLFSPHLERGGGRDGLRHQERAVAAHCQ